MKDQTSKPAIIVLAAVALFAMGACSTLRAPVAMQGESLAPAPATDGSVATAAETVDPAAARADGSATHLGDEPGAGGHAQGDDEPGDPLLEPLRPLEAPLAANARVVSDLFDRIRDGFALEDRSSRSIDSQLYWYVRNPDYLDRVFSRAGLYLYHIVEEVQARQMPMEIALLPLIESAFQPYAYSRARASGLWQFVPGTGERFGLKQNWWYDGRRDVIEATRGALDYLAFLHDKFNGDWLLAVAAYNCGEYCVARAVRQNLAAGRSADFFSLRLPSETRSYVPKLLAMKRLIADPEGYGIAISAIRDEPYFTVVPLPGQIDMKLAAELAGISAEELYELNSAFHRFATDPAGPHRLLIPADTADVFRESVATLSPDELMRVSHHDIAAGETLASIATQYHTQPHVIRELNDLGPNDLLRVGSDLRVPSGATALPEKVMLAAARVDGGLHRVRGRPVVHVVRRGDSLWTIARRNNMNVATLARINGINPRSTLRTGQRLVLNPAARASSAPAASTNNATAADSGTKRQVTYVVRRGDNLWQIARIFQVTVTQIAQWNGLTTRSILRPGQRLKIHVSRKG
ncbi:MAG: LysM peptidoglycan-binding domain-containing protein [Steroidobacteraceae bacterium]